MENEQDKEEVKEYALREPLVIHDGECEHYWEPLGKDEEGIENYKCRNCPMGKRLRDEWRVKDGIIYPV